MTRINSNIRPIELSDQHLKAEIRELPRIFNNTKKGKYKSKPPENFTLNKGHELFFTDKLLYLIKRHKSLVHEARVERGFNIMDYSSSYEGLPKVLLNNWEETDESRQLLIERINSRIDTMKSKPLYYGEHIDREHIKIR